MTTAPSTSAIKLQTELNRPILIVGDREELVTALPDLKDALTDCKYLRHCGELPSDDPATELAQRIASIQPEIIWIVGGDGTINMVGQCALRADWTLPCWLTPAGTANDLSRALSEHSTFCAIVDNLSAPTVVLQPSVLTDLMSVKLDNNPWVRCAANMFTLGTSARNTHHVTTEIKARWGALAYLTQIWRAMGDLEPFSVRMSVGSAEEVTVDNILNIFVANGPYCGGGFRVAPTAQIDDRLLDVVILRNGTTAELAHLATTFITGRHFEHELVEHFTTNKLSIECTQSAAITLDGEAFHAAKMEIENSPARLPLSLVSSL